MEHVKKLMLVGPVKFDTWRVKRRCGKLDQNISAVLDREVVNDYEKIKLYQTALIKFLVNWQVVENELEEPIKVSVAESKAID